MPPLTPLITNGHGLPELEAVQRLLSEPDESAGQAARSSALAADLATHARKDSLHHPGLDALLTEYSLDSREGVVLMCLAEALLRIPDRPTREALLHDLLETADWQAHRAHSHSQWVNAVTWGLLLTGSLLRWQAHEPAELFAGLLGRLGQTTILTAVEQMSRHFATHFVAGENMEDALQRGEEERAAGYRHSYDMLGEAARTAAQARDYFDRYQGAISSLPGGDGGPEGSAGISVKLSALSPRFDWCSREHAVAEISQRLRELAHLAREKQLPMTVDAEEARHLELTLQIFANVYLDHDLRGWEGLGLAVQAYQPRAPAVIDWLQELQQRRGRRLPVRLVKGAYWDSEIKFSQMHGHPHYPVFTSKAATDLSYLSCARQLLATDGHLYPQFATHNAYTVARLLQLLPEGGTAKFEFQRLHGMGRALHDRVIQHYGISGCRIYAPVGRHQELLPYLVRRLLENGANASFVHAIADPELPISELTKNPRDVLTTGAIQPLPLPAEIFSGERRNAPGLLFECSRTTDALINSVAAHLEDDWRAAPVIDGQPLITGKARPCHAPGNTDHILGTCHPASAEDCRRALQLAEQASQDWRQLQPGQRADLVGKIADLYWQHRTELLALLVLEAGKTLPDALAELREAIDFCLYYGQQARRVLQPQALTGPTGESNTLHLAGRGPFACISPWNFPLAIFTGQIVAALVSGNTVLAKPASATPLIAARAHELMLAAGITPAVLQLLPAGAAEFSAAILASPSIAGVAFTGSMASAAQIQRTLAGRDGPIVPLIAETGGQNAMIVDSSALTEQVVDDVLRSAFNSAGQRCSALRMLYLQEEIADDVLEQLAGALAGFRVGDPLQLDSDCGPLISAAARQDVQVHISWLQQHGRKLAQAPAPSKNTPTGYYLPPQVWLIDGIEQLQREVFGPVLHVARYARDHLDEVIAAINATGYGLTLGIASRLTSRADQIARQSRAGNIYVNRDMIGATVGVQPFGGNGCSGTGPKAGGPHYLLRFVQEITRTVNTTAIGGNPQLLSGSGRRPV